MPQVEKHAHDLEKLLDEASKIVPTAKLYQRPQIEWSEDYRVTIWGEYHCGDNKIIVSRILDTKKISHKALLQLICHELSHQDYADEEENIDAVSNFSDMSILDREIDALLESGIDAKIYPNHTPILVGDKVLFCYVPFDSFINGHIDFSDYGRYVYILSSCPKGEESQITQKQTFPFAILITHTSGEYYIAGWIRNCIYYSRFQKIRHQKFGLYDFNYNLQSSCVDVDLIPQGNLINFPNLTQKMESALKQVRKNGVAIFEHTHEITKDCLSGIATYPYDIYRTGIYSGSIHDKDPIISQNVTDIINKAYDISVIRPYRGLCLANKAVSIERNYETLMTQGFALHMAGYLDESLAVYREAMSFDIEKVEPYIYALRILCMMDRKEEAMLYASLIHVDWSLKELKIDETIRNIYDVCMKQLRIEPLPEIYEFTLESEGEA